MIKPELIYSIVLHLGIILATVVASPFEMKSVLDDASIIHVNLKAMPEMQPMKPVALEPVAVPEAVVEDIPDIPLSDPTTMKAAEIVNKPKPKAKDKPKKKTPKPTKPKTTDNTAEKSGSETDVNEIEAGNVAGSPFAGATVDNANFNYDYWFTQTFNKISSNYRNTISYNGKLVCTISFQVIRSGRVLGVRIEKSSGIDAFDQVCLDAVERSAPFPPLPRSFRDEIITLNLPITNY